MGVMEVLKRVEALEIRVKRLEEMIGFEELSENEKKQLQERMKKPDFIKEKELWRELGV
ncbi:hypothetical protein [Thermococcus sp.]|uniref:hypothetical protein n=1 Tax=Thermococcus sp. TaxID=35749 RepID=UPI0025D776DB|nr:hypothetical protein [Thermococcus sp.]